MAQVRQETNHKKRGKRQRTRKKTKASPCIMRIDSRRERKEKDNVKAIVFCSVRLNSAREGFGFIIGDMISP